MEGEKGSEIRRTATIHEDAVLDVANANSRRSVRPRRHTGKVRWQPVVVDQRRNELAVLCFRKESPYVILVFRVRGHASFEAGATLYDLRDEKARIEKGLELIEIESKNIFYEPLL